MGEILVMILMSVKIFTIVYVLDGQLLLLGKSLLLYLYLMQLGILLIQGVLNCIYLFMHVGSKTRWKLTLIIQI